MQRFKMNSGVFRLVTCVYRMAMPELSHRNHLAWSSSSGCFRESNTNTVWRMLEIAHKRIGEVRARISFFWFGVIIGNGNQKSPRMLGIKELFSANDGR